MSTFGKLTSLSECDNFKFQICTPNWAKIKIFKIFGAWKPMKYQFDFFIGAV